MRFLLLTCLPLIPGVSSFMSGTVVGQPATSRNPRVSMMVGFGQTQKKTSKSKEKSRNKLKEEIPQKTASPPTVGELPEDAFSMFPPLSSRERETLRRAEDVPLREGEAFPAEIQELIRERHGFKLFDASVFPGIRLLYADPVVFEVEGFFTPAECDSYIAMSTEHPSKPRNGLKPQELRSATTNAQSQFQQQRTSTTWFHHYASAPELVAKASALLGVEDYRVWEEPQTVRYRPGERFSWHLDALPPSETGASKGGQRTATVLVYLTDAREDAGGATAFRDLGPLRVRPKKGKCLVFFPTFGGQAGSPFDGRTLHAGEVVVKGPKYKEKYIAQLWCHKRPYPAALPEGNSHEAAQRPIAEYMQRWRGTS